MSPNANVMLAECLATRVRLANRVVTKIYDDAFRPHGLTTAQMSLLAFAISRGELRQSEACANLQIDDSTLSRNVQRMEKNGWIEELDAPDARVRAFRVTAMGRKLFESAVSAWRSAQASAHRQLGRDGVRVLREFSGAHGLKD
jgi:DNA-binding MarR family transcriptional regulator